MFTKPATYSASVVKSYFGILGYKSLCTSLVCPPFTTHIHMVFGKYFMYRNTEGILLSLTYCTWHVITAWLRIVQLYDCRGMVAYTAVGEQCHFHQEFGRGGGEDEARPLVRDSRFHSFIVYYATEAAHIIHYTLWNGWLGDRKDTGPEKMFR